jgi:hypothetical protein
LSIGEEIKTNFSSFHVHSSRVSLRKFRQPSKSCVEWSSTNIITNKYVCLLLEKLVNKKYFLINKKYFPVKQKFGLISRKIFSFYFRRKHFLKVVKNLKISYYLLIISNLVLKLLIAIYFVWIFFFSKSSHKIWFNLIFILTLVLIFMIIIYFYLIIFVIEIFYLSNLVLILLIVTYFIWIK